MKLFRNSPKISPDGLTAGVIAQALRAQLKGALAKQPPETAKAIADPANQPALDAFITALSEFSALRVRCDSSPEQVALLITAAQAYLDAVREVQASALAVLLGIDPATIRDSE